MKPPRDFIEVKFESGSCDIHYSIYLEELPEKFRMYAQSKLNETEENKRKGFKKLKDFLKKEGQTCPDDDIINVLRWAKYDFKKAESKLKSHLKFRRKTIELLKNMDEKKAQLIMDDAIFCLLPYTDRHGRIILYTRPNLNFDLYCMEDLDPLVYACVLYIFSLPFSSATGIVYLAESKAKSMTVLFTMLKRYRTYINLIPDLPLRLQRMDIFNESILINWFYRAVRPVLPSKITDRVKFNGNSYEDLKEIYHPDILPADVDGNLKPVAQQVEFREGLLKFIEKLKAENNIATTPLKIN